jgi:hydroxyacylglutathione hydrolase
MLIDCFCCGPVETNTYVIACPKTKKTAIIDPSMGSFDMVHQKIQRDQLIPTEIYLTHSHWDHIADCAIMQKTWNIPIWVHSLDAKNVTNPGSDGLPQIIPIEKADATYFFEDQMKHRLGELQMEVIHTPGHSPGCICLYFPKEKIIFTGDTLFQGTMGRLDLPTGIKEKMWESLKKLSHFPPETVVFPGHGPKTTIGDEKWMQKAQTLFG